MTVGTNLATETVVSAQIALNSTGDKATFTFARPVDIVRWGIIADALIDVGVTMVVKLDHRPTAGSDTNRTDGIPDGTTTKNITTGTTDIAQGKVAVVNLATPFSVDPGEQVVAQVTDAADTAGTGIVFIEYIPKPFAGDTTLPSAQSEFSNRIANVVMEF